MSLFARSYDLLLAPGELLGLRQLRRRLLALAGGNVLELGAGTGLNLPYYHPHVSVVLTEPDNTMLNKARSRLRGVGAYRQESPAILQAGAQYLPFRDGSFDAVVATLVFCTVPDPLAGLKETYRVLQPGGRLLLLEHVRAPWRFISLLQDAITPLWRRLAGGCHPNRDTLSVVQAAGFHSLGVRRLLGGLLLEITAERR